jgi:hypothetical protein
MNLEITASDYRLLFLLLIVFILGIATYVIITLNNKRKEKRNLTKLKATLVETVRELEITQKKLIEEVENKGVSEDTIIALTNSGMIDESIFLKNSKEQTYQQTNSGGYIILDLPSKLKSMFHDLLKGFEEFAKLKGYDISFSIDNSMADKIGFKFTLQENSIDIGTQTVRNDIKEYIEKVKKGEDFDDLPIVISPIEHSLVSATLKNRMSFLQHNYQLEKNTREHYENLVKLITTSKNGFSSQPIINIHTGENNSSKNLIATNSHDILQGDNNIYDNHSDYSDNSTITISNSFNTRKEQIGKIEEIIKLIKEESEIKDEKQRQFLITTFDKIKEELADEEKPDKSKISKWLSNIKKTIEGVVLSHHTYEAVLWLYDSFKFIVNKI